MNIKFLVELSCEVSEKTSSKSFTDLRQALKEYDILKNLLEIGEVQNDIIYLDFVLAINDSKVSLMREEYRSEDFKK